MTTFGTATLKVTIELYPVTNEDPQVTAAATAIEQTFESMLSMMYPGVKHSVRAEIAFTPETERPR